MTRSEMTIDIQALRKLIADVGGSVNLHAGHLADPDHSCKCRYIFDEGHAGGIAEVFVDNGKLISEGGNDAPKEELAIAYMNLLVGAANALPALLDELEARNGN